MDVNDVLVFSRVAQAGSFSKAAKSLGMPVSTVSRRVAELEAELMAPLLIRTTRSLKITEVGKTYLEHGRVIADALERAKAYASNLQSVPQGLLKITAPSDFGNHFLGEIISGFLKANPKIEIDVVLTERVVDLVEEGFDLAIRIGELGDSTLVARKLGTIDSQLYASPAFLKKHGEPKACRELPKFPCVLFTAEEEPGDWRLEGPHGATTVRVSGRARANDFVMIRDLARSGDGIALMPHFLCTDDVKAGRLVVLLKDWVQKAGPIHAVYPGQRFTLPKVRAFVDHLAASCASVQWRYRA